MTYTPPTSNHVVVEFVDQPQQTYVPPASNHIVLDFSVDQQSTGGSDYVAPTFKHVNFLVF